LVDILTGKIPFSDKYIGGYREIQIHGDLKLGRDVASLHVPVKLTDAEEELAEKFVTEFGLTLERF
jgi:hypothetical protein